LAARRSLVRVLWVCIAGAVGTGARYLLGEWILRLTGPLFPWDTLVINALGSFLVGAVMQVALAEGFDPTLRVTLTTGLMGGFTTYSTFNYETLRYFEDGALWLGGLNAGGTVVCCLVAGRLGMLAGRWLMGV
jgi:CrcB protein